MGALTVVLFVLTLCALPSNMTSHQGSAGLLQPQDYHSIGETDASDSSVSSETQDGYVDEEGTVHPHAAVVEGRVNPHAAVVEGFVDPHADVVEERIGPRSPMVECPPTASDISCSRESPYRTIDGSCNNLENPTWGQAMQPFARLLPAHYNRKNLNNLRRTGKRGKPLPSTRKVSTTVHSKAKKEDFSPTLTTMHMLWGQFIDHDITRTPLVDKITCCDETVARDVNCIPIDIPENDPFFGPRGITCMELRRSKAILPGQCEDNPHREQLNSITAFLDAGAVYGSTDDKARQLRAFYGGRMNHTGNSLPFDKPGTDCNIPHKPNGDNRCYAAGDKRVNVWPSLISIHELLVIEHNRIADILYNSLDENLLTPDLADDLIYEETRRIISALLQVITYKEYLPAALGNETMNKYNLNLAVDRNETHNYNSAVDPTVANVFPTAAFRFGHAQISFGTAPKESDFKTQTSRFVPFKEMFNQPKTFRKHGGFYPFLRGVTVEPALHISGNGKFAGAVRDKLFAKSFDGKGLDLPAVNAQRGRDHGIPTYRKWRKFCDLPDIKLRAMPDHNPSKNRQFGRLYNHKNDIDLFPAAVSEIPLPGAQVGPTFACLLGIQFQRLKDGDRFWFESQDSYPNPFTTNQIEQLSKIRLSKLICVNDNSSMVPEHVFKVGSPLVPCDDLPGLDLTAWLTN